MKGQSLVVQFILFFLIGLSIFLAISNFFKLQSDIFREDVADVTRKTINSYLTSIVISSYDTCKQCDSVNVTVKLQNTSADYFYEIFLTSSGMNVISQPVGKNYLSSMHNLIYSLAIESSSVVTQNPITLTYSKNQNNLGVK